MRRHLLTLFTLLVLLFLLSPLIVLVISAFDDGKFFRFPPRAYSLRWFEAAVNSAEYRSSVKNSSIIGLLATLVSLSFGSAAALGLTRGALRGKRIVEAVLLAPLVLPLVIWAIGLLQVYAHAGLSGSLGGMVLAHASFTLPFTVRIMVATFANIDPRYEEAAMSLGAHPLRAFARTTLPMAAPGLIASAALSFFISFNDVIVSTFIAGASWITFPVRLYSQLRGQGIDPTTLAIGAMIMFVILLSAGIAELFSRRIARR